MTPLLGRKIFIISIQQQTEQKIILLNISKAIYFLLEHTLLRFQLLVIPTDTIQLLCLKPKLSLDDFRSLELCLVVLMNVFQCQMENMLQLCQVDHKCVKLVKTQMSQAHIASCVKMDTIVQNKEKTVSNVQNTHFQTRIRLLASLMISSLTRPTICII